MISNLLVLAVALLTGTVQGVNFPWESIQLNSNHTQTFSAIDFGDRHTQRSNAGKDGPGCKAFPGNADWPMEEEWNRLNASIDGVLLKPLPAGAACYPGPLYDMDRCKYLVRLAGSTRFYLDDPLTTLTQWTEGNSCLAVLNAQGNCTQGGFPVYVVNATNVKQIQAAVNFARNKNIRLVIKNTGHDFGGRSAGAGSLSIWVHHLKSFEYLPKYTMGEYTGKAVRVAAGIEAWEMYNHMAAYNITVVAPGGGSGTVGMMGGWLGAGGHSNLVSTLGLGSDQALSIQVITADGRLVTADPYTNSDLFWAMRGGGAGTYGVMTSYVMKAYPPINTTGSSINLAVVGTMDRASAANSTLDVAGRPGSTRQTGPNIPVPTVDLFWRAMDIYFRFGKDVVDAGGMVFTYIYAIGNDSFSFSGTQTLIGVSPDATHVFMQPLYDSLRTIGLNLTNPKVPDASLFGRGGRDGRGESPKQIRYRSRLFPRRNWATDATWNDTIAAIRRSIEEAGPNYTFHGVMHAPRREVAGWPGADSAVNPAWRDGMLHASLMEQQALGLTAAQARESDTRAQKYIDYWRAVTPGSGAYMNEGDPAEPGWQQSFFGGLYPQLLEIKKLWDPWGLFWAPTTVGSEEWEVRVVDGYPHSQNGMLCLVKQAVE